MNSDNLTETTTAIGIANGSPDYWVVMGTFAIGFIILLIGSYKQKQIKFMIYGIIFFIIGILYMLIRDIDFRNFLVALASIVALYLSYLSLKQSEKIHNENMIKDDKDRKERLDREQKDRKERKISEVIDWALEVVNCGVLNIGEKFNETIIQTYQNPTDNNLSPLTLRKQVNTITISQIDKATLSFNLVAGKSYYILELIKYLDSDLSGSINKFTDELLNLTQEHVKIRKNIIEGKILNVDGTQEEFRLSLNTIIKELTEKRDTLHIAAREVIRMATALINK